MHSGYQCQLLVVGKDTNSKRSVHTCNCGCMYNSVCVYMCARVHVRVCDDNYMYKEEWVAGPNTNKQPMC